LLLHNRGLVKSSKFKNYKYVGDPINAVKIYNEKEVDEIAILDIAATREKRQPDIDRIAEIVSEAFVPLSYGGGVSNIEQAEKLFYNGVEKLILNNAAVHQTSLITQIAEGYGSQSVTASVDYKSNWLGRATIWTLNGSEDTKIDPVDGAKQMQDAGAGEILLNSIDRDGTYKGYDLPMIEKVARAVSIPVVACGGAADITDFRKAIDAGASAAAAGSMFVFQRPHNAVLISYPSQEALKEKVFR